MSKHGNGWWTKVTKWLNPVRIFGLTIGAFGLAAAIFGTFYKGRFAHDFVQAFYANVATETVSIAITVVVIDWLYERRDQQREKAHLVREMRSPENARALQAVEELRAEGWLNDRSLLAGRYLWDANLQGVNLVGVDMHRVYLNRANLQKADLDKANLGRAHLERANLHRAHLDRANLEQADLRDTCLAEARLVMADLQGAHLQGADLQGADLDGANLRESQVLDKQLARAARLRGVILPDGRRYDGRFNLPGDLETAHREGVDASDPAALVIFYGVSLDEYRQGQVWAQEHLPGLFGEGI